jgi:hypothetical protein
MLVMAARANAQTIRGTAVDNLNRPVSGAVIQLLDSAAAVANRTLSTVSGTFAISAPAAGTYRLRILRIGFSPETTQPYELRTGSELRIQIPLAGRPIVLDTIRVAEQRTCRARTDSADVLFRVWERARTAIATTEATAASQSITSTTLMYAKRLDAGGRRVLAEAFTASTDSTGQLWKALPVNTLRKSGYVVTGSGDSTEYRAPGLDMLSSDAFVEDHCFRLKAERDKPLVEVSFEPRPERRAIPEIKGTLWIDRTTLELRRLRFEYTNLGRSEEAEGAGGDVEFMQLINGAWVISRWNIRMPMLAEKSVGARVGQFGRKTIETVVEGISMVGGDLVVAQIEGDTLWKQPPARLSGIVLDSASGQAIAGASVSVRGTPRRVVSDRDGRFVLDSVLPGAYVIIVGTSSLDSMRTVSETPHTFVGSATPLRLRVPSARQVASGVCGPTAARASVLPGIIVGAAIDSTGAPRRGAQVVAMWNAEGDSVTRRLSARADATGTFRICGLPIETRVVLGGRTDNADAELHELRIASDMRLMRATLNFVPRVGRVATFTGFVVADVSRQPIGDAEVSIAALGLHTRTTPSGAFRLANVAEGTQEVLVRRVGFAPATTKIDFQAGDQVERRISLDRAVVLDTVVVAERENRGFAERRKLGLGHFITREEIEKREGAQISSFLEQIPGMRITRGHNNQAWPLFSRVTSMRCTGCYVPEMWELQQGMRMECYALVYLDGHLMNRPTMQRYKGEAYRAAQPFNVNSLPTTSIESIEYYAGPSQTPMEFSGSDTGCGVLVIWTKRR